MVRGGFPCRRLPVLMRSTTPLRETVALHSSRARARTRAFASSLCRSQSNTLRPYLTCIRSTLEAALCLRNFPSQLVRARAAAAGSRRRARIPQLRPHPRPHLNPRRPVRPAPPRHTHQVERHNKPEVEDKGCKELLLNPLLISRSERESVLIEPSINSVRLSVRVKQADEMERILVKSFTSFLMKRAEQFLVLRRKPVEGYDISFLITHAHAEAMVKAKLIDFIIAFMEDIDREVSAMRLAVNARARGVAAAFLEGLSGRVA